MPPFPLGQNIRKVAARNDLQLPASWLLGPGGPSPGPFLNVESIRGWPQ
jgi:hypothetical protein